jgi:hypothetical protein
VSKIEGEGPAGNAEPPLLRERGFGRLVACQSRRHATVAPTPCVSSKRSLRATSPSSFLPAWLVGSDAGVCGFDKPGVTPCPSPQTVTRRAGA